MSLMSFKLSLSVLHRKCNDMHYACTHTRIKTQAFYSITPIFLIINLLSEAEVAFTALIYQIVDPQVIFFS